MRLRKKSRYKLVELLGMLIETLHIYKYSSIQQCSIYDSRYAAILLYFTLTELIVLNHDIWHQFCLLLSWYEKATIAGQNQTLHH